MEAFTGKIGTIWTDSVGQFDLAVPPAGEVALRLQLSLLDHGAYALCDSIYPYVDLAFLTRVQHVRDYPRDLQPSLAGGRKDELIDALFRGGGLYAMFAAIRVVGPCHITVDASLGPSVEKVALGAGVEISPCECQLQDPPQSVLGHGRAIERQGWSGFDAQCLASKHPGMQRDIDRAVDNPHRGFRLVLVLELLARQKNQRHGVVGIGVEIREKGGLCARVIAALTMLLRQQVSQGMKPQRMRFDLNSVLDGGDDVDARSGLAPFLVPAVNFIRAVPAADCSRGGLIALSQMLVGQEPVQDLQPARIGFSFDPLLHGANDAVADMRATQLLAPAVDLVEGLGIAHGCSMPVR